MLLFFPETQRKIVGNGSAKVSGTYWSLFSTTQHRGASETFPEMARLPWRYPNPLASLPVLRNRESLLTILMYAFTYSVKMTLQTSLGAQCAEIYGLNYLTAGLIYLLSGVAGAVGSFGTGTSS